MYCMSTWSPTFSWSKFFTSGPAVTVMRLPSGPFSVTSRVVLSMAVIVAVIFTVCAAPTIPGAVPTTALVCARGGNEAASDKDTASSDR